MARNNANNTDQAGTDTPYQCRATQLFPAWKRLSPNEPVAMDIEFQDYKHEDWKAFRHRVGRVAIVNSKNETVLDVYAYYDFNPKVRKLLPPPEYGVTKLDLLRQNGAVHASKVELWVKQILKNRTVVLWGGKHDLNAFCLETDVYANSQVIDLQPKLGYLLGGNQTGLASAAQRLLGRSIQATNHSPVEDAQATMDLYKLHLSEQAGKEAAQSKSNNDTALAE